MTDFSRTIDSIVINDRKEKVILNNQTNIDSYLLKHRHGFAKRKLTIKAK